MIEQFSKFFDVSFDCRIRIAGPRPTLARGLEDILDVPSDRVSVDGWMLVAGVAGCVF
ncbi:hypothetical protein [Haloarcula rubra]|uniref:hypothetical protein n=1 Tax=Haloarcula rubra TaxID=2487747 RepID=UPI001F3C6DB2|nr:hypothetical protein [Halomicroarcula rubra]